MSNTVKRNFPVVGMGCAACVARVEGTLKSQDGVKACSVSLAANSAQVEYDPSIIKASGLKKAVQDAGYDLMVQEGDDDDEEDHPDEDHLEEEAEELRRKEYRKLRRDMVLAIILAVAIFIVQMGFKPFKGKGIILLAATAVSVFWCGRRFHKAALAQVRHFRSNMDTLVSLSTLISFLFSCFNLIFPRVMGSADSPATLYFDSAAMITAFILIGRVLEEKAKYGTTASIRKLMGLRPRKVKAAPGDVIRIKPGQNIPVDGTVTQGASFVDESLLTGEPVPAEKFPGSKVYTGTVNQKGTLQVMVEKTGSDTLLSGIISMVRNAQGSKARIQQTVDKVAAVFVPVILLTAIATFIYWCFIAKEGGGFGNALLYMVSVLVIACPCSLGLATPTAIVAGIGKGADEGILIKDADALQTARKIKTLVLDKTGTITAGKPEVIKSKWFDESTKGILLSMEQASEHPLAPAVISSLGTDVSAAEISGFEAIPGKGIEAASGDVLYFAGNSAPVDCQIGNDWITEGYTVTYFCRGEEVLAVFAISDPLKDSAVEAVMQLHGMGITVCMLTGDNEDSARLTASQAGIDETKANVLPDGKAEYIRSLQGDKTVVAMAGDGINDSAALATADVSIAMGHGSDIAIDTSMVTIVSSDLTKIPRLIDLSKRTSRIIAENLFWAFIYNVIAIPLAAGAFHMQLNPMIAAACMALSSVCVVSNSLRLRK